MTNEHRLAAYTAQRCRKDSVWVEIHDDPACGIAGEHGHWHKVTAAQRRRLRKHVRPQG